MMDINLENLRSPKNPINSATAQRAVIFGRDASAGAVDVCQRTGSGEAAGGKMSTTAESEKRGGVLHKDTATRERVRVNKPNRETELERPKSNTRRLKREKAAPADPLQKSRPFASTNSEGPATLDPPAGARGSLKGAVSSAIGKANRVPKTAGSKGHNQPREPAQ
ncbi:hypothetical protein NQ317_018884 [Molorchus minor]|uniref:Uncharacterized protein n=1 Tax=Molorchus minor TaxID=1323400 RepID=A0ABQ9JJ92_9CUCU|nr:hypothetical protein NQ317_018884 [Molorchus minor]